MSDHSLRFRPDVIVCMKYTFGGKDVGPEALRIETNARLEALDEILTAWVQDHSGGRWTEGPDGPATEEAAVEVVIGLRLADDVFGTSHTCGAKTLAMGVVLRALALLDDPTTTFADLPK